MKKIVLMAAFLVLVVSLTPAAAVTLSGRATTSSTPTWTVFHGPGGMLVVTVYWKTRNSLLFLVGTCDDGASFVSGSMQDRFTHVQIEVDPDTSCEIQARSRRGSSKFWINFRGSGIFGTSSADEAIRVTRSDAAVPLLDELARLGKERPR